MPTRTAGVDVGAQDVKVVILEDGKVISRCKAPTGFEPEKVAQQALADALARAGLTSADLTSVLATGSGMRSLPFANGTVSMMGADARAGSRLLPSARIIVDIGAEEARAVKCDSKGSMTNFVVNERCAAGAGTFIEAMARALEVRLDEMGPLSLGASRASSINASCVIFGESDVVTLIHRQEPKAEIARAVFDAMAERTSSMLYRLGVERDIALVGGVARDVGFVDSLNRKLGTKVLVPEGPEFVGAMGAALLAEARVKAEASK